MKSKDSLRKKVRNLVYIKNTLKIYSEKAGRNIRVTINPLQTENERLKRIIGLSNSVTTG